MDRKPVRAEEAASARDGKRHDNPVPAPEIRNGSADFFNDTHELVADDKRLRLRNKPVARSAKPVKKEGDIAD